MNDVCVFSEQPEPLKIPAEYSGLDAVETVLDTWVKCRTKEAFFAELRRIAESRSENSLTS